MCLTVPTAGIDLPASTQAPTLARRFVAAHVCVEHPLTVADDAELLTSEVVTNAVFHGWPPIRLSVECAGSHVEIRVSDGNPGEPLRRDGRGVATHGRGVALVDLLADRWGVQQHPGAGKDVWFTLTTRRPWGIGAPSR